MPEIEVSFVIPCLNEEKTIEKAINMAKEAIKKLNTECEIVISDNGSTDNSTKLAIEAGARVVHTTLKGYGNALIYGIKLSHGKYIVMGDADGTYNFRESVLFIEKLREGNIDLVMGSRITGNIEKGAMPYLHRYLGTPVLTYLIRRFFKIKISDCNCGMRAFTKEAFESMNLVSGGMEFASEMLIKAGILKMNVCEIPCSLYRDTRGRPPHLRTWHDGWRHLKYIMIFAPKYLYRIPGMFLLISGLASIIILTHGVWKIGNITFDYHFMFLSSLFLLSGYQILWLEIFEKYFVSFAGYFPGTERKDFNLERHLLLAVIFFITGVLIGGYLGINWIKNGQATFFEKRMFIISADVLFFSIMTLMNSFIVSMMDTKIRR